MNVNGVRTWFRGQNAWVRRLVAVLCGFIAFFSLLFFTPTPYYITAPGAAIDTGRLIEVDGGEANAGRMYMLVVTTQPANLFWYLYAKLDPRAELQTRQEFLGDIPDYEKYLELTRQMMVDSQRAAKAIALHQLGYGKGVQFVGVKVTDLQTNSAAQGHLQKDDIIVEASGRRVTRTGELSEVMRATRAGAPVMVRVRRGKTELSLEVPTAEHPQFKGTAAFGIFIKDEVLFDDQPVPVTIKSGQITGPSAGMMFTLQIMDQLTPGGLAPGLKVAGTGTIEPDGRVGRIGGMKQKVHAAEAAGADVIFVPRGNAEEALQAATRIQVVVVDHVRDALAWLEQHGGKQAGHRRPAFWL